MGRSQQNRPRSRTKVTFVQLVTSLVGIPLLSAVAGLLLAAIALPAVTVAGQAATGSAALFESLPQELKNLTLPQSSQILASDGTTLLATFYDQNRVVVPLEEISPWMQMAQVDIEDKRFWEHNGVDGEGLLRAGYLMVSGQDKQGASTITQQLVKNTLLEAALAADDQEAADAATEVSVQRKVREWRLALAYEERLNVAYGKDCDKDDPKVDCGKEQVLETYLNIAQYGTNLYGVEAAAALYFGVEAKELTFLQAATIAGITQNPTKWDPLRNPELSESRRNMVLEAMYDAGHLSLTEYSLAAATPIAETLNPTSPQFSCAASVIAPFFCNYVTKIIVNDPIFEGEGRNLLYQGGLRIVTTLDVNLQNLATATVTAAIPALDSSGLENALVALDNTNGNILAMAQNRGFDLTNKIPGMTAINYSVNYDQGGSLGFSPGSSFKAIVLAQWLNSGRSLTQVVSGSEREWPGASWKVGCPEAGVITSKWKPGNVSASENGQTTVLNATAHSINTAYVSMENQLDLCQVRDMAFTLGFQRADGADFQVVPSVVLGSQNASPLTMASVYQTFANRGVHCTPRAIVEITDLNGQPVYYDEEQTKQIVPPPVSCNQVISPDIADGVTYALQTVLDYGTAKKFDIDRPAAGKTGTAQNNSHLWFVGYTPQITAAVWSGNAEGDVPLKNMTINGVYKPRWYGGDLSLPVWHDFMVGATGGLPPTGFNTPSATIMNGVSSRVPSVVGIAEKDAQNLINDAGFLYVVAPDRRLRPDVPEGTIVDQSPAPDASLHVGGTVTYWLSTAAYPGWWYNWPLEWDEAVRPSDYWGSSWPPAEFTTTPPAGYVPGSGPGV